MVNQLRTSLADTLTEFYPLAGRMKDQIFVDCNDEGVCYLVAPVDVKLQDLIESPEIQDLDHLIPYKSHGSTSMADEQLAIQVNLFQCGGVAIGFGISHRIADGCSLCTFIKAWSQKACGNSNMLICPVFDSASHFPPRCTPDFKPNTNAAAVQPALERLVAKRFIFTPSAVSEMKMNVMSSTRQQDKNDDVAGVGSREDVAIEEHVEHEHKQLDRGMREKKIPQRVREFVMH